MIVQVPDFFKDENSQCNVLIACVTCDNRFVSRVVKNDMS